MAAAGWSTVLGLVLSLCIVQAAQKSLLPSKKQPVNWFGFTNATKPSHWFAGYKQGAFLGPYSRACYYQGRCLYGCDPRYPSLAWDLVVKSTTLSTGKNTAGSCKVPCHKNYYADLKRADGTPMFEFGQDGRCVFYRPEGEPAVPPYPPMKLGEGSYPVIEKPHPLVAAGVATVDADIFAACPARNVLPQQYCNPGALLAEALRRNASAVTGSAADVAAPADNATLPGEEALEEGPSGASSSSSSKPSSAGGGGGGGAGSKPKRKLAAVAAVLVASAAAPPSLLQLSSSSGSDSSNSSGSSGASGSGYADCGAVSTCHVMQHKAFRHKWFSYKMELCAGIPEARQICQCKAWGPHTSKTVQGTLKRCAVVGRCVTNPYEAPTPACKWSCSMHARALNSAASTPQTRDGHLNSAWDPTVVMRPVRQLSSSDSEQSTNTDADAKALEAEQRRVSAAAAARSGSGSGKEDDSEEAAGAPSSPVALTTADKMWRSGVYFKAAARSWGYFYNKARARVPCILTVRYSCSAMSSPPPPGTPRAKDVLESGPHPPCAVVARPPSAVQSLSATAHTGYAVLRFTPPEDKGSEKRWFYTVTDQLSGQTWAPAAPYTISKSGQVVITLTGLMMEQHYRFVVRAGNSRGHSGDATAEEITILGSVMPRAVNVSMTPSEHAVTLEWGLSPSVMLPDKFQVTSSEGQVLTVAERKAVFVGLPPRLPINFTILCLTSDGGHGLPTATASIKPYGVLPLPPAKLTAVMEGAKGFRLTWTPPPPTPGVKEITGYTLTYHTSNRAPVATTVGADVRSAVMKLARPGYYTLGVAGVTVDGSGTPASTEVVVSGSLPPTPANVTVTSAGAGAVLVLWNPLPVDMAVLNASHHVLAASLVVTEATSGGMQKVRSPLSNSVLFTGLPPLPTTFTVTALTASGEPGMPSHPSPPITPDTAAVAEAAGEDSDRGNSTSTGGSNSTAL